MLIAYTKPVDGRKVGDMADIDMKIAEALIGRGVARRCSAAEWRKFTGYTPAFADVAPQNTALPKRKYVRKAVKANDD